MAASTGGEDLQESPSTDNSSKVPSVVQQNAEKVEDVSTNGTVPCNSFLEARKNVNVLKPSVFSSNVGSPMPVFGSNVSSSCANLSGTPTTQHFGSTSQKTPFSLRPSLFGSFSSPNKDVAVKRPVVLRASQLEPLVDSSVVSSTNSANSSFVLSPAKLNNPFYTLEKDEELSSSTVSSTSPGQSSKSSKEPEKTLPTVSFVPLASSAGSSNPGNSQTPVHVSGTSTVPSFVFGQNLHERVEVPTETVRSEAESSDAATSDTDGEVSKTNGTAPEMLFSSVIQKELPDKQSESVNNERKRKSLSEAAREYEESRAVKKKYEEVTVKTGEEEEINIIQINCKLFAFNKDKSTWVERGRGTLRLNDLLMENRTQSRVVMRVSGSLRVVLNTKIWAEMAVDKPSEKSIRITAMDNSSEIKVFLIMASVKEIDQLFKALDWRVNNQKKLACTSGKNSEINVS